MKRKQKSVCNTFALTRSYLFMFAPRILNPNPNSTIQFMDYCFQIKLGFCVSTCIPNFLRIFLVRKKIS